MTRNKTDTSKKKKESYDSNASRGKLLLAEGSLIGWLALSAILFLSLISFSSEDPGWSYTGSRGETDNLIGPAGAWVSDIAFQLFGVMAYLLPALMAFRALQVLRTYVLHEANEFDSWTFALRIVGFILVMISATSLAYIQYEDISHLYPQGMG